jgi:hypothetical protein
MYAYAIPSFVVCGIGGYVSKGPYANTNLLCIVIASLVTHGMVIWMSLLSSEVGWQVKVG